MISPDAEEQLLFSRVADPNLDFLGKRLAEWYNLNLLDSLPKVTGSFTLRPAAFDLLENRIYYTAGGGCGPGLLDFFSVAWLSDPANPAKWVARASFLPVMTAGQRPEFKSEADALDGIITNDFNPRAVVFLPEAARALVTVSNETVCTLHDIRFGQNQIESRVEAAEPSLVVLSQTFYHLWHAELDGQEIPLLPANIAFQAVQVPAGVHQLKLVYRDPNLSAGAAISLASLLTCVVIWFRRPPAEKLDRLQRGV